MKCHLIRLISIWSVGQGRVCVIVALFLLNVSPSALAQDTIYWAVANFPPRLVVDDQGLISGQAGIQLTIIETGLSEYKHEIKRTNYVEFIKHLQNQDPVCSSLSFKTPEREKIAIFSKAVNISLQPQLVLRTQSYRQMGSPEKVKLTELVKNPNFRGGLETDRSYARFDEILLSENSTNITTYGVNPEQLMGMLNAGTIDYTIEYSYRARYLQQIRNFDASLFSFVDIEEGFGYALSYVVCPKNDWGRRVIEAANRVLEVERVKPGYLKLIQMIYADEKRKDRLAEIYQKEFLQQP